MSHIGTRSHDIVVYHVDMDRQKYKVTACDVITVLRRVGRAVGGRAGWLAGWMDGWLAGLYCRSIV